MRICHVDPVAETVVCPAYDFAKIMKATVSQHEELARTRNRLDAAIKLGLVDLQMLEAKAYELQTKLNNPWRSPWLWGIIGACAGTALGVGLVLGIK